MCWNCIIYMFIALILGASINLVGRMRRLLAVDASSSLVKQCLIEWCQRSDWTNPYMFPFYCWVAGASWLACLADIGVRLRRLSDCVGMWERRREITKRIPLWDFEHWTVSENKWQQRIKIHGSKQQPTGKIEHSISLFFFVAYFKILPVANYTTSNGKMKRKGSGSKRSLPNRRAIPLFSERT